jgi:hypothetical protein
VSAVTCRSEALKLEQIADRLDAMGVQRVSPLRFVWNLQLAEFVNFQRKTFGNSSDEMKTYR